MKPVKIDEANALRVRIDLVIDRKTGNCRWNTQGMSSANDMVEQHLIFQAVSTMLDNSLRVTEAESKAVN